MGAELGGERTCRDPEARESQEALSWDGQRRIDLIRHGMGSFPEPGPDHEREADAFTRNLALSEAQNLL